MCDTLPVLASGINSVAICLFLHTMFSFPLFSGAVGLRSDRVSSFGLCFVQLFVFLSLRKGIQTLARVHGFNYIEYNKKMQLRCWVTPII